MLLYILLCFYYYLLLTCWVSELACSETAGRLFCVSERKRICSRELLIRRGFVGFVHFIIWRHLPQARSCWARRKNKHKAHTHTFIKKIRKEKKAKTHIDWNMRWGWWSGRGRVAGDRNKNFEILLCIGVLLNWIELNWIELNWWVAPVFFSLLFFVSYFVLFVIKQ